jgi:ATP-dependent Clp protease ATP-binding subunit ClpX
MSNEENLTCSFCSKARKDTKKMIVGAGKVTICNECVTLCNEILDEDQHKVNKQKIKAGEYALLNPVKIKEFLDLHVIGQDTAKTVLSVAVSNHYKRIVAPPEDLEIEKSNVLMLGPTGSGKTLLAKTIARYLDVPFAIADATSLTEAGYVGDDVENIISKLMVSAKGDRKMCERGIVFIDEIDKICRKSDSPSITRDVSGEGVQQGLLKIVEGSKCRVPPQGGRKHPDQQMVEIDTTNILFIVSGAFGDLERQIRARKHSGIGFGASLDKHKEENILANVQPKDLINFGLIPEFVGRFSMITHVNELSEPQLVSVLTDVKNSLIKQYKYMFGLDNIELEFTKSAKYAIAKQAKALETNARGLKNVLDKTLLPFEFDAQEMSEKGVLKIIIDENCVDNGADPKLVFKNDINTKTNKA